MPLEVFHSIKIDTRSSTLTQKHVAPWCLRTPLQSMRRLPVSLWRKGQFCNSLHLSSNTGATNERRLRSIKCDKMNPCRPVTGSATWFSRRIRHHCYVLTRKHNNTLSIPLLPFSEGSREQFRLRYSMRGGSDLEVLFDFRRHTKVQSNDLPGFRL